MKTTTDLPPCTRCGGVIEYNGNYYCTSCDWSLPADIHLRGARRREVQEFHLAASEHLAALGKWGSAQFHALAADSLRPGGARP